MHVSALYMCMCVSVSVCLCSSVICLSAGKAKMLNRGENRIIIIIIENTQKMNHIYVTCHLCPNYERNFAYGHKEQGLNNILHAYEQNGVTMSLIKIAG